MASLSSSNPHAKHDKGSFYTGEKRSQCDVLESAEYMWSRTLGDAVENDSKRLLAVNFNDKCYILADIRRLSGICGLPAGNIALEFFFDGDTKEFGADEDSDKKQGFFEAFQETICNGVKEYYRRKIDNRISFIGNTLEESFRDAGCMLSFIAIRVFMTEDCAKCIGSLAFPEYFGMASMRSKDPPIPKWLLAMAVTAVVFGIAMLYAWSHILLHGNIFINRMYNRSGANAPQKLSTEELTSEMIANLTMTQLVFILQRIQQLSFHSADYAKELLTESPQLALALIHAQYLVSGKSIDSKLLPLTADEVKIVKDRIEHIREGALMDATSLIGAGTTVSRDVGLSKKFHGSSQIAGDQVAGLTKLLSDMDPQMLEKVVEGVMGEGGEVVDLASMVRSLLGLSAEQIAALPEHVQRLVLKLLEQSLST